MQNNDEFNFYWHLSGNEDVAFGQDAEMRQICLAGALRNAMNAIQESNLTMRCKIQLIETALRDWCNLTLQLVTAQMELEQEQRMKGITKS